jgi:hypothetical protein
VKAPPTLPGPPATCRRTRLPTKSSWRTSIKKNPNKRPLCQLPLLRDWQAYPGDNGLAITQVIYDGIEGIVTGEFDDMKALQQELVEEVNELTPQG